MDNMRISGTGPLPVILSQKSSIKSWKWCPKVPKISWSQKGWFYYNKPTKLQFQSILTQKIVMFSIRYKSNEVDQDICYMCPWGLTGSPEWRSTSSRNIKTSNKMYEQDKSSDIEQQPPFGDRK